MWQDIYKKWEGLKVLQTSWGIHKPTSNVQMCRATWGDGIEAKTWVKPQSSETPGKWRSIGGSNTITDVSEGIEHQVEQRHLWCTTCAEHHCMRSRKIQWIGLPSVEDLGMSDILTGEAGGACIRNQKTKMECAIGCFCSYLKTIWTCQFMSLCVSINLVRT